MRITFIGKGAVPDDVLALRKPILQQYPPPPKASQPSLAIVGGGTSIHGALEEIRSYPEIWAINGTWRWCAERGIDATLITMDAEYNDPAPRGLFADVCLPEMVERCQEPHVFKTDGFARGTTTATIIPHLAISLGYREVVFFGCEGSFGAKTHAFKDEPGERLWVRCDGQEFVTNPQMYMQTEVLSEMIRLAPHVFKERSGGFLSAMINDPEPEATGATAQLHAAVMEGAKDGHRDV